MNVISLLTPKAQVAYLYEDFTVRQGLEKMRVAGYTAIPVLARDNSIRSQEKIPLSTIMRGGFNPPVSVGVSLDDLLERAMRQSFIPVVDDRGAFVGIVTRQNIIRRLTVPNEAVETERMEYAAAGA